MYDPSQPFVGIFMGFCIIAGVVVLGAVVGKLFEYVINKRDKNSDTTSTP